jgi:hypothetical protein
VSTALILAALVALAAIAFLAERRTRVRGVLIDFDGQCVRRFFGSRLAELYLAELEGVTLRVAQSRTLELQGPNGERLDVPVEKAPPALMHALRSLPGFNAAALDEGTGTTGPVELWRRSRAVP